MPQTKRASGNNVSYVPVVILILFLLVAVGYMLNKMGILNIKMSGTQQQPVVTQTQSAPEGPTPTPTKSPLPQGIETYNVSQGGAATGPMVSKIVLNPHDPKVGETFIVRATAGKRNANVTRVVVTEKNDKTSVDHEMKLVTGTAENGDYEASWNVTDTHDYTFSVIVKAYGADGTTTTVDLAFRTK